MKKYYLFIALSMVAAMTVSCKNNKKAEADAEVVEAAKTILTDDVLATLDELAESFKNEENIVDVPSIISSSLTEQEKLIKPDYLLDPAQASEMVTKSQKLNALAILLIERNIRIAYNMPVKETDEVIARFAAEVNDPISYDEGMNLTPVEKTKKAYDTYKERGDLAGFWKFFLATHTEVDYLVSKNTDAFFRNLNEEQYASFLRKIDILSDAAKTLAEYDPEVKQAWDVFKSERVMIDDISEKTIEDGKIFFSERKDVFASRRANLLK